MPDPKIRTSYRYHTVAKRDRNWGLFITTTGESTIGPGTTYPPAGHPKGYDFCFNSGRILSEYLIVYISSGNGWFKSGNSSRAAITAGDVFLIFPEVWHSYAPSPESGWTEHWVGFDGALPRRLMRHQFFDPAKPVLRTRQEKQLSAWFKDLIKVSHANHPALQQIMAGITMQVLGHLYSTQQSKLAGDDPALDIIGKAVTRVRDSFGQEINFADVARELSVSYSWFRRAFAQHTGLSPHQYLLDIRLAHARDLLAGTSLSSKEIAAQVGFEDHQYFCRLFHKKVGWAPLAWRKRARHGRRGVQKVQ